MTGGRVLVLGLSEVASATAIALHRAGWRPRLVADAPPRAHRRRMCFADVWWDGRAELDGLVCLRLDPDAPTDDAAIPFHPVRLDAALAVWPVTAIVDARLAKREMRPPIGGLAALTIGCGPGHVAGETCDRAIETQWGDRLGAVVPEGPTNGLAGEPRSIEGVGRERIVYAAHAGPMATVSAIGDPVRAGRTVAWIGRHALCAPIDGTLRGLVRPGLDIRVGDKVLEVDPRPPERAVFRGIGQRPTAIAHGVLAALTHHPAIA